ncbi:adenylate/guanylate cyclase domain-containing protein [uncultured Desulfobacter sp.]|uniref:adenylate/guanylate cyclase domain-containing protein n=1 Tax=uncultured Desulfobacter sp. TaxID=240139 RepID=UPI002AABD04C|nr:adenylate/guanylate cyclase domain-containing protein [uncultured Desulfobacter sp.]
MTIPAGKKFLFALWLSLVISLVTVFFQGTGILDRWESKARDIAALFFAAPSGNTDKIKLVLLDQKSLDWVYENLGITWPWPRELHGAVLSAINRHGAGAIGVDVLFTEPSAFGVDDDLKLCRAMQESRKIVLGSITTGSASGSYLKWPVSIPDPGVVLEYGTESGQEQSFDLFPFPVFTHAVMPTSEIANSAQVLCNVRQEPDPDGINRGAVPLCMFDGKILPILSLGIYLFSMEENKLVTSRNTLKIGAHVFPMDRDGRLIPRFRGKARDVYDKISCAALIQDTLLHAQGEPPPDNIPNLNNAYVFYGFSAPGLVDLHPTPMGGKTPGVEFHATLLDNFLTEDFMYPVPFKVQLPFLFIILVFTIFLLRWLPFGLVSSIIIICSSLLPALLFFCLYRAGFLIHVLPAQFTLVNAIFLSVLVNFSSEGKQRRFIKHSFNHYLSPSVIEELINHPESLQLGGQKKELTIFFSDLQGFTSISEALDPEILSQLLNDYLSLMTDIIMDEGGTVDKYEGDAIIAFWNAPLGFADHALRGTRAAVKCQEVLAQHRPSFKKRSGHDFLMRIGMNTGMAVVGNFGSSRRFDYTMLGDAVNLAARLEGINKMFGTYTLISEYTWQKVCDTVPARAIADILVIGREEPVRVYEPLSSKVSDRSQDELALFEQGREAFAACDVQKALSFFQRLPHDPPAKKYVAACEQIEKTGSCPYIRDGIWVQTSK